MIVRRVDRYDGIEQLRNRAALIDEINAESSQPSPFHSSAFLISYATFAEFHPGGIYPYTYIAYGGPDGNEPIGWLVIRRERVRLVRQLSYVRIDFLATHDNDHCSIVAKAGAEREVIEAILDRLVSEKDWSLVEFRGQEQGSLLRLLAHDRQTAMTRVRDIDLVPFERVPLDHLNMGAYFSSLSKRMRSNVSRQTRNLYAAGRVELLFAEGGEGVGKLFDVFCDLENRSWKFGTDAAMQRHPARIAFYRELACGRAGLVPSFVGVVLNGVVIAGLINASGGGHTWSMEMAFDRAYAELGPGQILLLVTVGEAIRAGNVSLRFFQHHEYFKKRWLAEQTPAVNVQLIRTLSPMGAKAAAGDLRRLWVDRRRPAGRRREVDKPDEAATDELNANPAKREIAVATSGESQSREVSAALLSGVLAGGGGDVRLVGPDDAQRLMPFTIPGMAKN